ncbi:hypothetical protein BGZ68_004455, partial [Mortierella alpina]
PWARPFQERFQGQLLQQTIPTAPTLPTAGSAPTGVSCSDTTNTCLLQPGVLLRRPIRTLVGIVFSAGPPRKGTRPGPEATV